MAIKKIIPLLVIIVWSMGSAHKAAADDYSFSELSGSAMPYPIHKEAIAHPDSLRPVMIVHVGRHGARFATSDSNIEKVRRFLERADSASTLTDAGSSLLALTGEILTHTDYRWGQLDSLGVEEQRAIAERLYKSTPELFGRGARIHAISSWKSRCVMSMYTFLHQLTVDTGEPMEITAVSGSSYGDSILRFFDYNDAYKSLIKGGILDKAADDFTERVLTPDISYAILSRLATSYSASPKEERKLVEAIYATLSGCEAAGIEVDPSRWMTIDEYRICWESKNLSQYLRYSESVFSDIPADMAAPLLRAVIADLRSYGTGSEGAPVKLYFGHAETLMPLFSLMRLKGAHFVSADLGNLAENWRNFDLVPMAANITFTLFESRSGEKYLRTDVNGTPIRLLPGSDDEYPSWNEVDTYLTSLLP